MNGPYYYSTTQDRWFQLTYQNTPFDNSFAINGDGTDEWNRNGSLLHKPILNDITFDTSHYISTGTNKGYGIVSATGTITIDGKPLEITYTYNLGQDANHIVITCKIKNIGTTTISNVRSWLGTHDDWIGTTDRPTKTKGNIVNDSFVPITAPTDRAKFLKIESDDEGALFYTAHPRINTAVSGYGNWGTNNVLEDPTASAITLTNDGAYAMYVRLNDLEPNESDEFEVYYAAGLLTDLDDILWSIVTANGFIDTITTHSAVFNTTPTQNVTGYYLLVPEDSPVPTVAEIINGQDYQNVAVVQSGNAAIQANQLHQFSLTNLAPNTTYSLHYVNQRDNGGSTSVSSIVSLSFTTLESLEATFDNTDVSCYLGSTGVSKVIATGGLPPYTYLWTNGMTTSEISQLPSGTYTVEITDQNNESISRTTTITEPDEIVVEISKVNVSCHGENTGSATVTATGGASSYTYHWNHDSSVLNDTATELAAGNYEVTVTDTEGCSEVVTITIEEPALVLPPTADDLSFCLVDEATVLNLVAVGTDIAWYDVEIGGSPLAETTALVDGTTYYATQTINGCESQDRKAVTVTIEAPVAPIVDPLVEYTYGDPSIALTAIEEVNHSLLWYTTEQDGTGSLIAPIPATNLAGDQEYWVSQITAKGCDSPRVQIKVIVRPAALTVTPHLHQSKVYGAVDPVFTYSVSGLQFSDTPDIVLGTLTREQGENVGHYAILQEALTAPNYDIFYDDASFEITTATLTITVDSNQSKVFGDADPVLRYGISGLQFTDTSDVLTGALTRELGEDVGTYGIEQGSLASNSNYELRYRGADFEITKALIRGVELYDATFGYDGTAKSLVLQGELPTGTRVTYQNNSHTNLGVYTVTATIDGGRNYIDLVLTAVLTIEKGTIIGVHLPHTTFMYDGTVKSLVLRGTLPEGARVTYEDNNQVDAGRYLVTAHIDGGGNYNDLSLVSTLTIQKAQLGNLSFTAASFVYDGTPKSLSIQGELPMGTSVTYQNNHKTEAGIYTVTANILGGANYMNLNLTARMTIEKATQTLSFTVASPVVMEEVQAHQLNGTASSELPVRYTYTYDSVSPAAEVSESGWLTFNHTGTIQITVDQEGNNNYHSAPSVTRTLVIGSKDASIHELWIEEEYFEKPASEIAYRMDCEDLRNEIRVRITTQLGAQVDPGHEFVIEVPTAGTHRKVVRITSQNGKEVKEYTIRIERPFKFSEIAKQKYDNVLLINNNPKTNGGYKFVKFEWYKNGEMIGTKQAYSAGKRAADLLDVTAEYHAILTTDTGDIIQVCPTDIRLLHQYNVKLYPSPAQAGKAVTVKITYPLDQVRGERLYIYDLHGRRIATTTITAEDTEMVLPSGIQTGTYMATFSINGQHKVIHFVVE